MNKPMLNALRAFVVELGLYALFLVGYFLLVLHFLQGWLFHLFKSDRQVYAWVALGLMLGQGLFLELMTRILLTWIRPRAED